jgi:hypothetical protein
MKALISLLSACALALVLSEAPVFAADQDDRLNKLEDAVRKQQRTIEQQQETISSLKTDVEQQKGRQSPAALSPPQASGLFGGGAFANPNLSVVLDAYYYSSNLRNEELGNRSISGFTPNGLEQRRGFNVRTVELSLFAPVDPYFNFYANLPVSDEGVEVEEAYVVTTALPTGWQVKGGKFKSNVSRLDAQHPHAWDFWDIALPYRAFLGSEGLGGEKGVQITYLPALPVYTLIGAEVLQGENDLLFGADARETPHAYSFFVKSSVDTGDNSTLYFGPSVLFGRTRNQSIIPGDDVAADSALYGLEAVWKWKPANHESLIIQGEYLYLDQRGTDEAASESLLRKQDGAYIQAVYRKNRWGVGVRYDALHVLSDTFERAGVRQSFGSSPWRDTASIEYNPSEFTRVRVQFTHDKSDPSGRTNDEAIVQFNFAVGAHPAHSF